MKLKKLQKAKLVSESSQHLNIAHKKATEIKVEKVQEAVELGVGDRIKIQKYKRNYGAQIKGNKAFIENDAGMKLQVMLSDLSRSGNPPPPKVTKKQQLQFKDQIVEI